MCISKGGIIIEIQWMGFKELLENTKCYLAAKIVVIHFQLSHLRSCNHFKVPEVTVLGYLLTQVKQNDRQMIVNHVILNTNVHL